MTSQRWIFDTVLYYWSCVEEDAVEKMAMKLNETLEKQAFRRVELAHALKRGKGIPQKKQPR